MSEKISISSLQKKIMTDHYQKALDAKSSGKLVVYVTALSPVEIVRAFEPHIAAVYPENHAVNLIVNGAAEVFSELAITKKALDRMGCSYELANTGYLLAKDFSAANTDEIEGLKSVPVLAKPDILFACNNQCDVVAEWFQNLSRMYGDIPFKVINVGNRYDGIVDKERINYVKQQLLDVISLLEKETGTKLDRDKLMDTAKKSAEAVTLWRQYLESARHTPSPITVFEGFYNMALIVAERGRQTAVDYYKQLTEETQRKLNSSDFAVKPEKYRILWDNLATWFNFSELKKYLCQKGIAVVASNYLAAWERDLDLSSFDNLLNSMAEGYCAMYTTMTIEQKIDSWKKMVTDYNATGILFHNNKSCHTFSRLQGQVAEALIQEFGSDFKPIIFDGDMGLKERFQKHRFETAIETYFC